MMRVHRPAMTKEQRAEVESIKRSDALRGFVVQAHRRLMERTFG